MLKSFRYLLFPFSLIYGAVIWLRNYCYDKNIFKSSAFNFPVITVGNLAVGGTGKTPMVEYLIRVLRNQYQVATLSRGYKRKTKGFAIADPSTTALEIGDEPMQFHQKFPDVVVAVGEERLVAIPQLLHDRPGLQVILLDDAFQHRQVKAGLNILLTEYRNLFTRDFMLPAGDLRDIRASRKRADVFVVTKCPAQLSLAEKTALIKEIAPAAHQSVFFTETVYGQPYHLFTGAPYVFTADTDILLICGIANPRPLKEFLAAQVHTYQMQRYNDHHIFSIDDMQNIRREFDQMPSGKKILLTTEKDAVRLHKFDKELRDYPFYVLPVAHSFLFEEEASFQQKVLQFIQRFA